MAGLDAARVVIDDVPVVVYGADRIRGVSVHDGALICYATGNVVEDYRIDRWPGNGRSFPFEVATGRRLGGVASGFGSCPGRSGRSSRGSGIGGGP